VARLEHGEILRLGFEQLDDRAAAALALTALLDEAVEIRLPVAEMVVGIDDRRPGAPRGRGKPSRSARRRESARGEPAGLQADQRIDEVDDQQRSPGAYLLNGPLLSCDVLAICVGTLDRARG